jgi:hypothetical protein
MSDLHDLDSVPVLGVQTRRRRLLQVAGVAGAVMAAGIPVVALADPSGDPGKPGGKIHHGQFPVTGSTAGGATFSGLLKFAQFYAVTPTGATQQLMASGTLSGTFKDATGATVATLQDAAYTTQITNLDPPPSCQILTLTLGPLHLDLLGLVIDIPNPIVLNITAVPGNGNLLGNLLCAVANLLNPGGLSGLLGNLSTLITALNNLFSALNGL